MVEQTLKDYPLTKIDRLFVTLQSIYDSIIVAHGNNHYTITHMNKDKMEREGTLPRELAVTQDAIDTIEEWNNEVNTGTDEVNDNDEPVVENPGGLPAIGMAAPFVVDGDSSCASFGSEGDRLIEELAEQRAAQEARERFIDDLAAGLTGPDNDNDDEVSTNSAYSLNSEELEVYARVEAEMMASE
jgi:hypothetical protein